LPVNFLSWDAIFLEFPINEKINGYFDLQPRIGDDITKLSVLVVRPAIFYKITGNLTAGQGYSWQPHIAPVFIDENRPYQQLLYRKTFKKFRLNARIRTEERFIEHTSGASVRQRLLVRFNVPLGKGKNGGFWLRTKFSLIIIH